MFKNLFIPSILMQEDDGTNSAVTTPAPIDWSKVDWSTFDSSILPDDVVKSTKAYTTVLNETIERRQKIKELKDSLNKLTSTDTDSGSTTGTSNATTEAASSDITGLEAVLAELKKVQDKLNAQDSNNVERWQKEAAAKVGIKSARVMASLKGTTEAEIHEDAVKVAAELGIQPPPNNVAMGNPVLERDKGLQQRVRERLTGGTANDAFNKDLQRTVGGGVYDFFSSN